MVKSAVNSHAKLIRNKFKNAIEILGRNDLILLSKTKTYGSMGNVESESFTATTISGDLQPITYKDRELINLGWAEIGDAKLYVSQEYSINEGDEIEADSVRWRVTQHIEAPTLGTNRIFNVFLLKRQS